MYDDRLRRRFTFLRRALLGCLLRWRLFVARLWHALLRGDFLHLIHLPVDGGGSVRLPRCTLVLPRLPRSAVISVVQTRLHLRFAVGLTLPFCIRIWSAGAVIPHLRMRLAL